MTLVLPRVIGAGPMAVATRAVVKRYGRETALDRVDLQVPEGAVYVLVGPNGAGKSTLFRILLDLVRPDSGEAEVFGLSPRAEGPTVRAQIGYVPERHDWGYGWMRVDRLMAYHATFFPPWDHEYARYLAEAFELRLDRKFGVLSKGEARRVQLVLALAHRPRLLLLDEPTDGLDPVMRDETMGYLVEHLSETNTTALISTHRIYEVDRLADHIGVMRDGRLITQISRDLLHRMMRRYRADVPDGWSGAPELNGAVFGKAGIGREIRWAIWGEEREVVAHLTSAGARVRDVAPMTLEDAALAFLSRKDR